MTYVQEVLSYRRIALRCARIRHASNTINNLLPPDLPENTTRISALWALPTLREAESPYHGHQYFGILSTDPMRYLCVSLRSPATIPNSAAELPGLRFRGFE